PGMHVHAFSPMEVVTGASKAGVSIKDWLESLRDAGLDTIPGTAAEILDDEVRWVLTKGKLPTATWVEVVTTAHELGIRSSGTLMEETISRMAGSEHGSARTVEDLEAIATKAGRPARQRTTLYGVA